MFNPDEMQFIRHLAEDVVGPSSPDSSMSTSLPSSTPRVVTEPGPARHIGSTDYKKFEQILNELEAEEAASCGASSSDSPVCQKSHTHDSSCQSQPSGCTHDHTDEKKIYEKPFADKLAAIRLFREEGNSFFKQREFDRAGIAYRRALLYLDYTFGETEKDDDILDTESAKCHLNLAAVQIEKEDYRGAINQCRLAIRADPKSVKAFFRRGTAYMRLGELELAEKDLSQALEMAKSDSKESVGAVQVAIRELNAKWSEYRRDSSALAKSALK